MSAKKPQRKRAAAPLEKYRQKRNFGKTPEPDAKATEGNGNTFVVQEHHARTHHFDFRLEMDGVLVSWAVPKGIPEDSGSKRLAVHVEDHPLEYGSFEGEIPQGNYGAGTVTIWDSGTWEPIGRDWRKKFAQGKLKFSLMGGRLNGSYLLARMGEEPNWLMRFLADEAGPTVPPEHEAAEFVAPQLARVVPSVPSGNEWLHEIKYDGYRLIVVRRKGKVRLHTRSGLDWTDRFPGLVAAFSVLTKRDFVIDGEAVVFDGKGRSRFGDLQSALQHGGGGDIEFVAFDLLHFDGLNLRNQPLSDRLAKLSEIVGEDDRPIRLSKTWSSADGKALFEQACAHGLEGIISKKANGRYIAGSRKDWTKSKCRARQEFVICGHTRPKGDLPAFGALVLGSYENGKLVPRGKVGTGFSDNDRRGLLKKFKPLEVKRAPFKFHEPSVTWLEPKLVAEIEFAEITREGSIRQGSFIGLREDKTAPDVHIDPLQTSRADGREMKVAGIAITHADRLVYPDVQITKLEVARYYERVGKLMAPHVINRPLAILRAPEGLSGQTFFQKSFTHLPPHVFQKEIDGDTSVFYVKDVKGLVSLAQHGALEIHLWGARLPKADKPDVLTWDLDPDSSVPWNEVLGAAMLTRDVLLEMGLSTVVKTSGGKGLHVILHLKRSHDWAIMKDFTKAVAQVIADHNPKRFVVTASKARRKGRIYIDWMRNGKGATCVAPWSLRAKPGASVSMPVNWRDLRDVTADGFTLREPSSTPNDWSDMKPQTIPKTVLRKLGLY